MSTSSVGSQSVVFVISTEVLLLVTIHASSVVVRVRGGLVLAPHRDSARSAEVRSKWLLWKTLSGSWEKTLERSKLETLKLHGFLGPST